ncbi:Nucleoporin GLE1 [Hyphodiscus hymeniophilus]|uniref:mRNA export factor GLE1 n=1 Tax=Hyphodiscus hymeniophilus TaxID=353542 RepID=A0A9P6VJ42_9HELO|nr:Nucleoporin GLE1 [Hyphodiscus hymeniophilus]
MSYFGATFPDFDLRFENRNSEEEHAAKLAASHAERLKINEAARRAVELEEIRQNQFKLRQHTLQEEERVRLAEERIREETRLREIQNRERQIPKVPERLPTPPAAPVQEPKPTVTVSTAVAVQPANPFTQQPQQIPPNTVAEQTRQAAANPFAQQSTTAPTPTPTPTPIVAPPIPSTTQQSHSQKHNFLLKGVDRYVEIHQALKQMRKVIKKECETNKKFQKEVGDLRRELRMKVGQTNKNKAENKAMLTRIFKILEDSMQIGSPGVDPSTFMLSKPEPREGTVNNDEKMPMVFIFFMNMFAKYAILQFSNEAGIRPEMADPIGVIVVQVFARANFRWRGESLIDIFMAKMRMACPAVFGIRGSENTEQGRALLGWGRVDKGEAAYMSEEQHASRMTGLAAGYAAISLRDFSKSSLQNPWHASHYWQTLASIVATPPNERSATQYYVLRALVDGYESTFFKFYGNTARAALKVVLIDFPDGASAPGSSVDPGSGAVGGVKVLVEKFVRQGIDLRA